MLRLPRDIERKGMKFIKRDSLVHEARVPAFETKASTKEPLSLPQSDKVK